MSSDHGPRNDWGSTMSTFWISLSFGASCPSRTLWQKMSTAINPLTNSKSDLPSIKLLYLLSFRTLSISSELSLMYFSSLDCQSSRRTKPNRSYNLFGATSCRRQKCANKTRTFARQALWKILDYFILKWINRTCIVFIRRMSKTRKTWLLLRVNRDDSLRDRVQAECLGMSVKNAKPLNKSHKRFQQPIFWTKHLAVLSPPPWIWTFDHKTKQNKRLIFLITSIRLAMYAECCQFTWENLNSIFSSSALFKFKDSFSSLSSLEKPENWKHNITMTSC